MEQRFQKLLLLFLLAILGLPSGISAQNTREVLQLQFGKQVITVAADEEITFKDPKGDTDYTGTSSENAHSLTVFKPAVPGMSIQIVFESVNMGGSASYFSFANVYNGDPDADDSFTWATKTSEVTANTKLPDGDYLRQYPNEKGKTYTNETYYSSTADGSLSMGFAYRYAYACTGWVAKVKCVQLTNQQVTGAESVYSQVLATPASKQGIALGTVNVKTTGVLHPDTLTTISFKFTQNENMFNATALKLYKGNLSSSKDAEALDAAVTADGDGYRMTVSLPIGEGDNYFTIAGDALGTAEIGAKAQLDITGVATKAHAGGVSPFTAGTPVTVSNPAVVMISTENQTVTVGETPLNFYDDGGVDGDITPNFNGQVTFVPGMNGKKVQIDLTKLALANGSIYYQYMQIYNGTTADEAHLIKTLRHGETGVIHSTSADGALTVALLNNGTGQTAAGFEATVSLFTPVAMTVSSITASQITEGTVCAGDKDQQILSFNIQTENTEPALTADKFAFTTNGTNAQVTHATLYYTSAANAFASTTKVGEADVTADAFEITATTAVPLKEGNNYFWLTYSISDEALNGQKVDASIVSATLSGTVQTVANGNPEGDRTVENIVYSHADQGTVTRNVNESVVFKTKAKNNYSDDYESGTDERVNIFVPKHTEKVCQIDFESFDLYYAQSTYGTQAKFKVYSGKGTSGELLWELKSADDKKKGPGKVLRSTSTDGAITVVFSPNTNATYNVGKGFTATVTEYVSKPMTADTVTVSQTSTGIVSVGGKAQEIIGFNVVTSGDQNAQVLNAVTLNLKGSQKSVEKVYIYSVGQTDAAPEAALEAVGTLLPEATAASVQTIALTAPVTLKEGSNWFRVLYDVRDNATSGETIDAAVQSVKVGDNTIAVAAGDPDGERTIKNIFIMQAGDNGEKAIGSGAMMFYDDGGADGNASSGFSGTVTFAPQVAGESIKLKFHTWDVKYVDKMYLYHGGEVKADGEEDAKYSMYDKPTVFISDAADGKVTVKFTTGSSSTPAGFAIEVSSYKKKPLEVESVTTTAVAPSQVMKGQGDVQMLRIDVDVKGDLNSVDISKFVVDASSAVIGKVSVYATDTISTFAPTQLVGEATAAPYEVNGTYSVTKEGVYKFWVAADVLSTAQNGQTATAKLTGMTINATDTTFADATEAQTTVTAGMSGVITVGEGGDYGTIQAAVDAVSAGIDGPTVINVKRGIYNENVTIPEIPGMSAVNTLTLQSESGNYKDVRIYHNRYNEPPYSEDKMFHEYGVLTVNGADWFTLRGVEITTTDLLYPAVVRVKNVSRHVTIDSCYIHCDMTTDYSKDINLIYMYSKDVANQNNDYMTIRNCLLEGGYIGVRMGGTGYVRLPKEVGGVVEHNIIRNQGSKAIYVMDELGAKIRHNVIENNATTKTGFQGMDFQLRDEYKESLAIEGNVFNMDTRAYSIAINPRQLLGTAEAPVLIINNEINVKGLNASYCAIKAEGAGKHVNYANNTIRQTGTAGAAMWFSGVQDGEVNVINNVIQNESGSHVYNIYKNDNYGKIHFANNTVYTTGGTFAKATDDVATFDDWTAASGETGSYNKQVTFLSDEILEPENDLDGDLLKAQPLTYVKTDINGTPRAAQPTIGAYEYNASTEAPLMLDAYPVAKNVTDSTVNIAVKANMNSKAFVVVGLASEDVPTVDEVLASATSVMLHANTEGAVFFENLVTDSVYVAYSVLKNLRGTVSTLYTSKPFTMSGEVIVELPAPAITAEGDTVALGSSATLTAYVTDGTAPFTVTWMNGKHKQIGTKTLDNLDMTTISYTPTECDDYIVTVTDAVGKTASDTCRVVVTGEAVTATFENLWLDSESYWNGLDQSGSFVSGTYMFDNGNMPEWNFWYNFAYSNCTATTFNTLNPDQFNSAVGSGYNGSENYVVSFPQGGNITVLNKAEGDSIRGFYISNNAYAVECINNGLPPGRAFTEGDWLKVTITGTHADNTKATVEYYLADYRATAENDRYYLDTWQWVDLRSLGEVKTLSFAITGSDTGSYGLNTPAYFCLDNFNGKRVIHEASQQTIQDELDLSQFFTFENADATIAYALPDGLADDLASVVTLSADGKLTVSGEPRDFEVIVSATQRGKIQFVRIPVSFVPVIDGIDSLAGIDMNDIESVFTLDGKRITKPQRGINILRMKDGTTRKVAVK